MASTQPYSKGKGYHRVIFRHSSHLLHTELNEVQLREEDYRRDIIKYSLGANSYTTNNGFRVIPSTNVDEVIIWPGEIFVDGRIMYLSSPEAVAVTPDATNPINVWAIFTPVEITPLEDSDIVYPSQPVTAYRYTYELSFDLLTVTTPTPAAGELVFKLASIDHTASGLIATSDIGDLRPYWSNNYVIGGLDLEAEDNILIGSGEILLGNSRHIVSAVDFVVDILGSSLSPDTSYYVYYEDGSPVSLTYSNTSFPVDVPIVKVFSGTTDSSGVFNSVDVSFSDERVFAPVQALREILYNDLGRAIVGVDTLASTTGVLVDLSAEPEFASSVLPTYNVSVSVEGDGSSDQVGSVFIEYGPASFTIRNTGSDEWSQIRYSVGIERS